MLYPPKFEVLVIRSSAAEDSFVDIKFQGATQEIVKRLPLTKGILIVDLSHLEGRSVNDFIQPELSTLQYDIVS